MASTPNIVITDGVFSQQSVMSRPDFVHTLRKRKPTSAANVLALPARASIGLRCEVSHRSASAGDVRFVDAFRASCAISSAM